MDSFCGKGSLFRYWRLHAQNKYKCHNLAGGIKDMFLDKHGAMSVFAAFQTVVEEKLPVNLCCSMGFV